MRRKPKIQYIMLSIMLPTAMAPMYDAAPKWPAMVRSTRLSSGTVTLDTMLGTASLKI